MLQLNKKYNRSISSTYANQKGSWLAPKDTILHSNHLASFEDRSKWNIFFDPEETLFLPAMGQKRPINGRKDSSFEESLQNDDAHASFEDKVWYKHFFCSEKLLADICQKMRSSIQHTLFEDKTATPAFFRDQRNRHQDDAIISRSQCFTLSSTSCTKTWLNPDFFTFTRCSKALPDWAAPCGPKERQRKLSEPPGHSRRLGTLKLTQSSFPHRIPLPKVMRSEIAFAQILAPTEIATNEARAKIQEAQFQNPVISKRNERCISGSFYNHPAVNP